MPPQKSASTLVSKIQKKFWFQHLVRNTQRRNTWQALFDQALPSDMVGHYHVLDMKGSELFVGTDNAAWAARLRYATPQILLGLQRCVEFSVVRVLHCAVMPPVQERVEKRSMVPIPESAARSMIAVAETISDPDLKAAMLKLAKNVGKS